MKKVLIIGQGIAGTVVSKHLKDQNISHDVFDNNHHNASTLVAAGMWNPIVFRRLNKSWEIDALLPYALMFYERFQQELDLEILKFHKLYRFFNSPEDANNWMDRSDFPGFEQYMFDEVNSSITQAPFSQPYGYGVVKQTGRVLLHQLIKTYKKTLLKNKSLIEGSLNYIDLKVTKDIISFNQTQYEHVVFCEGYQGQNNPFFGYLPLQLNKGETLTIEAPDLKVTDVLNRGFFILPLGNNQFKVGATFNNKDHQIHPTEVGKQELIDKLKHLQCSYKIVDHSVGLRPTVSDRRPLIGTHPAYKHVHIFNGLGSKGASIAPLMAKQFVDYLYNNGVLHPEADIKRFHKKFQSTKKDV